jgi:ribosome recycling factor
MSTVAEIKAAIPSLTLEERAEVARCLSEWQDDAKQPQSETPPNIREKLNEAVRGTFSRGDRGNISKILSTLK